MSLDYAPNVVTIGLPCGSSYWPQPGDRVILERDHKGILLVSKSLPGVQVDSMEVGYTWPKGDHLRAGELAHRYYRRHAYWEADYRPAKR